MQHMNHINSNVATINKSPTAWSLGGAILNYEKKVLTVMVNNSTNINKVKNHTSPQIIERKKDSADGNLGSGLGQAQNLLWT